MASPVCLNYSVDLQNSLGICPLLALCNGRIPSRPLSHLLSKGSHLGKGKIGINVKEVELEVVPAWITAGSQVLENIYGEDPGPRGCAPRIECIPGPISQADTSYNPSNLLEWGCDPWMSMSSLCPAFPLKIWGKN